jgi:hypothetical protein
MESTKNTRQTRLTPTQHTEPRQALENRAGQPRPSTANASIEEATPRCLRRRKTRRGKETQGLGMKTGHAATAIGHSPPDNQHERSLPQSPARRLLLLQVQPTHSLLVLCGVVCRDGRILRRSASRPPAVRTASGHLDRWWTVASVQCAAVSAPAAAALVVIDREGGAPADAGRVQPCPSVPCVCRNERRKRGSKRV